jgi:dTDP-4-amino-4,6-dideoxygalactose transaminase
MIKSLRPVPVYPTLAASVLRRPANWRRWFPFSAERGVWTFSGRVALYHGLPLLDLPPKSVILVPNYHQGVEIDTLLAAGYKLRYYRVDERLEIDMADVQRQLDAQVSALYVTHYFGFPQPVASIRGFCDAHGLKLIEDCALSLFSRAGKEWLGTSGDIAIFSIYKTVPLPHGGFLVSRAVAPSAALDAAPLRSTLVQTMDLINQTLRVTGWGGVERSIGRGSRMVKRVLGFNRSRTIQSGGALWDSRLLGHAASRSVRGWIRLVNRDHVIGRRRRNFRRLAWQLQGLVPFPFVDLPAGVCPLFFPIMVPDKVRFQHDLAALGVESVNLWDASHPSCPRDLAAEVAHWREHCLELPIHQELDVSTIDRVAAAVASVWQRHETERARRSVVVENAGLENRLLSVAR